MHAVRFAGCVRVGRAFHEQAEGAGHVPLRAPERSGPEKEVPQHIGRRGAFGRVLSADRTQFVQGRICGVFASPRAAYRRELKKQEG